MFIFRQVDYRDIPTFLDDMEVRSKNFIPKQACHQTSEAAIVGRRGQYEFRLPHGGVVNDYVAFYFSPITAFAFKIHQGNVPVFSPEGENLGQSDVKNRVFLVADTDTLFNAGLHCCYSNMALNTLAPFPEMDADPDNLDTHINWSLFNEHPIVAKIPEIEYPGVCQYFFDGTQEHQHNRRRIRMAEFLVKDAVPIDALRCVIVYNDTQKNYIQFAMNRAGIELPVYIKPDCFR